MAKPPRQQPPQRTSSAEEPEIVQFAREAVDVFRNENPEAYKELVSTFDGKGADLALLGGHGAFHAEVRDGEVVIDPQRIGSSPLTARGAASPETLNAIFEGRITPLEAFFKGDIVAQARSAELHIAYGNAMKYADAAIASEGLQRLRERFQERYPVKRELSDWAELD